jgi:DNA (cytosine-5)-methyltransferase 1
MKYLSLFSGVGGGDLGLQHLVRLECVGYVEWDKYCCRVLEQRIKDGFLADAPVFCGDIREWIKRGYAEAYSGLVDVVAGGFPCQPFSVAGKQKAGSDDRNMWPATIESIRIIRPQLVFFENVPGLLSSGYATTVASDLHGAGYQVLPPLVLGAIDVGAPHKRDRVWFAAHSSIEGVRRLPIQQRGQDEASIDAQWLGEDVADASSSRFCGQDSIQSSHDGQWNNSPQKQGGETKQGVIKSGCEMGNANSKRLGITQEKREHARSVKTIAGASWWAVEPNVGRVVDGVAHRMDRLKAIGNGQVPAVVREAWRILIGGV